MVPDLRENKMYTFLSHCTKIVQLPLRLHHPPPHLAPLLLLLLLFLPLMTSVILLLLSVKLVFDSLFYDLPTVSFQNTQMLLDTNMESKWFKFINGKK